MMSVFAKYLPSIVLVAVAAGLAFQGVTGWGWFLTVALFMYPKIWE